MCPTLEWSELQVPNICQNVVWAVNQSDTYHENKPCLAKNVWVWVYSNTVVTMAYRNTPMGTGKKEPPCSETAYVPINVVDFEHIAIRQDRVVAQSATENSCLRCLTYTSEYSEYKNAECEARSLTIRLQQDIVKVCGRHCCCSEYRYTFVTQICRIA